MNANYIFAALYMLLVYIGFTSFIIWLQQTFITEKKHEEERYIWRYTGWGVMRLFLRIVYTSHES